MVDIKANLYCLFFKNLPFYTVQDSPKKFIVATFKPCNDFIQVIKQIREKLLLNCAAVQIPIGMEDALEGVVDIVEKCAYRYKGDKGQNN